MANIFVCQIALTSIELVNDDDDDDGIDSGVMFRAQARAQTEHQHSRIFLQTVQTALASTKSL